MREVITTSISLRPEKPFFLERWSWFKFKNLGLAPGRNLRFYTNVTKGLKLKFRKFRGVISMFVEATREKLIVGWVGGGVGEGVSLPFCIGLKWLSLKISKSIREVPKHFKTEKSKS